MRLLAEMLNTVLNRRSKILLMLSVIGSIALALLDAFAVALVLPIVQLASGDILTPWLARLLSSIGAPEPGAQLRFLAIALIAVFVGKNVAGLAFAWWQSGFLAVERVNTSARIMRRILDQPYALASRRTASEIIRTADTAVVSVYLTLIAGLLNLFTVGFAAIVMLSTLLVVATTPTLILVAYLGAVGLAYDRFVKPIGHRSGQVAMSASLEGYRAALAAAGALKEVKLRGVEGDFVDRFQAAQLRGARAGRNAGILQIAPRFLLEISFILGIGLLILFGTSQGQGESEVLGVLALFVAAGFRLLPSLSSGLATFTQIRTGMEPLLLVTSELGALRRGDAPPASSPGRSTHDPQPAPPSTTGAEIEVVGVTFAYPSSPEPVLKNVDLTIGSGSMTALVGRSGSGKTTLADIVAGLHTPRSGALSIDGAPLEDRAAWSRRVGYVSQDVFILDESLAVNVAFDFDEDRIDHEAVRHALAQAQLTELVASLPDGISTQLGERGSTLSGGQRQRVGIARALYRHSDLLILDEATSALDNETEDLISRALAQLRGAVTTLVIAHRLSTLRDADAVVFMEDGRVVHQGTFTQVQAASRSFARMVELGQVPQ